MNLREIKINLEKVNSTFSLNEGAWLEKIGESESRLGIKFPPDLINFFNTLNGLNVTSPKLELFPVEELKRNGDRIIFGCFNGNAPVSFDVSHINSANQWDIVNFDTGHIITLTISSFLANKIWAWLHRGREVWAKEVYA